MQSPVYSQVLRYYHRICSNPSDRNKRLLLFTHQSSASHVHWWNLNRMQLNGMEILGIMWIIHSGFRHRGRKINSECCGDEKGRFHHCNTLEFIFFRVDDCRYRALGMLQPCTLLCLHREDELWHCTRLLSLPHSMLLGRGAVMFALDYNS